MKTRIASGLIGIVIFFAVLSQLYTRLFNIALFVLYTIAVVEINNAFKGKNVKQIAALLEAAGIAVFIMPLAMGYIAFNIDYMVLFALFSVGFASVVVFNFDNIDFMRVAAEVAFGVYVLFGFWSVLRFKEMLPYEKYGWDGAFMLILTAVIAWGGDVFAYFSGYFFGKHKLAPSLSPKKTKEGAVGGILGSVVLAMLVFWLYSRIKPVLEGTDIIYSFDVIHILTVGVIAAFGSAVGMIGDLFASAVKRHAGIKDYGDLMPGHGGVLDRFDSVLLVAPLISSMIGMIVSVGGVFYV